MSNGHPPPDSDGYVSTGVPLMRRVGDLIQGVMVVALVALVGAVISMKSDLAILIDDKSDMERQWAAQVKFNEQIFERLTTGGCNASRCAAIEAAIANLANRMDANLHSDVEHRRDGHPATVKELLAILQRQVDRQYPPQRSDVGATPHEPR